MKKFKQIWEIQFTWQNEYEMSFTRYVLAVVLPSCLIFFVPLALTLSVGLHQQAFVLVVLAITEYDNLRSFLIKKFGKPYLRPLDKEGQKIFKKIERSKSKKRQTVSSV